MRQDIPLTTILLIRNIKSTYVMTKMDGWMDGDVLDTRVP